MFLVPRTDMSLLRVPQSSIRPGDGYYSQLINIIRVCTTLLIIILYDTSFYYLLDTFYRFSIELVVLTTLTSK